LIEKGFNAMTYAILCNVCGNICRHNQYASLQAWHGKHQHHSRKRGRAECWTIDLREDIEQLSADVCRDCLNDRLAVIRLNSSKTRAALMQDLRAVKPSISAFEALRRTVGVGVTSARCDICKTECIDKHLKIIGNWNSVGVEELTSEVCERCVSGQLSAVIRFQVNPSKP